MSENSLPQSHVQIQPLPDAHMPPGPAATVQADTRWVHLFRAMIDSGDLARMDGSTFKVYAVIKAYTNIQTGPPSLVSRRLQRNAGSRACRCGAPCKTCKRWALSRRPNAAGTMSTSCGRRSPSPMARGAPSPTRRETICRPW
jgi:hypothetical protein